MLPYRKERKLVSMSKTIIIVDLEATCERDNRDYPKEVIEIGAVEVNGEGQVLREFTSFVRPVLTTALTPFCIELTSIRDEDVQNADTFDKVFPQFENWVRESANKLVLCSWGAYDPRQLKKDCKLHNIPYFRGSTVREVNLKERFAQVFNCKPMGMAGALRKLNIPLAGTHHRGIDDARNIALIYQKMYQSIEL